jgi:subtilisin family serine protease
LILMSHRKYIIVVLCALMSLAATWSSAGDNSAMDTDIRPGHVVVLVKSGYSPDLHTLLPDIPITDFKSYSDWRVESLSARTGLKGKPSKATGTSLLDDIYVISFPDSLDVRRVMSRIMGHPDVIYVEPDYKLDLFSWPTDSLFPQQWYLHNTGQDYYAIDRLPGDSNDVLYLNHGTPGEDVNMAPIYDNPPADTASVLVAIIDTGIDYVHPDLADKVYVNSAEIPDNGVDDDHNGLIDDYRGWDFSGDTVEVFNILGDNDATDSIGHGTHVSGLVVSRTIRRSCRRLFNTPSNAVPCRWRRQAISAPVIRPIRPRFPRLSPSADPIPTAS